MVDTGIPRKKRRRTQRRMGNKYAITIYDAYNTRKKMETALDLQIGTKEQLLVWTRHVRTPLTTLVKH
jgi:hypothetical protein